MTRPALRPPPQRRLDRADLVAHAFFAAVTLGLAVGTFVACGGSAAGCLSVGREAVGWVTK